MWIALSEMFKAAVGLFLFVLTVVVALSVALLVHAPVWLKQKLCKHAEYWENGSCDAVCSHCNKNLGFIGTVRKRRAKL